MRTDPALAKAKLTVVAQSMKGCERGRNESHSLVSWAGCQGEARGDEVKEKEKKGNVLNP